MIGEQSSFPLGYAKKFETKKKGRKKIQCTHPVYLVIHMRLRVRACVRACVRVHHANKASLLLCKRSVFSLWTKFLVVTAGSLEKKKEEKNNNGNKSLKKMQVIHTCLWKLNSCSLFLLTLQTNVSCGTVSTELRCHARIGAMMYQKFSVALSAAPTRPPHTSP